MERLWATPKTGLTYHRTYDSIASLRHDQFEYSDLLIAKALFGRRLLLATRGSAWSGYTR